VVQLSSSAIGMPRDAIDTPALLIDLDALERNIAKMAEFFSHFDASLRPHTKTHKTPQIARKQIEAGAIGVTCAKVGEAEAMVAGGIQDILVANQVVTETKLARLASLARQARLTVAIDDAANLAQMSEVAGKYGATIGVLVEVNIGMDRCGVEPGEPALALARKALGAKGIEFRGLMGYEGHSVMIPVKSDRAVTAGKAIDLLVGTKDYLQSHGVEVAVVSGGGTGTFDMSGPRNGMTEIQAGSYVTMDAKYQSVGMPFEPALTVLTTIISRPTPDRAVADAGMKAVTFEFGVPQPVNQPGLTALKLAEEHTILSVNDGDPRPGQKIELLPSHGCTTINLHDRYFCLRNGIVECVWEITARGKFA
jgi:D-serine deaminase-like pyridoxal phosphate-dependent protein